MVIAITGATGQLGRLVVDELLARTAPDQIIALARDTAKAGDLAARGIDVRTFDYDQPETLAPALEGVDRLLLISGNAIGQRVAQHTAVIEAAKSANVPFVAYTSVLHADSAKTLTVAPEHAETEKLLAAAPFTVAVLRNGWYSENLIPGARQAAESGTLLTNAGDGEQFTASRDDYATATAIVLTAEEPRGAIYELAGDSGVTQDELARIITDVSGKPVAVQQVSADEHRAALIAAGLPEAAADFVVSTDTAIAGGELADPEPGTLSRLIGRPTTPLRETLAEAFQK
ncbi:SDR family oxidoreductase [Acaricomes phytoseiuli]|uniref:SDR family oxidoreductase n=1 Tax=Acaricomes phytoseiuli TaxID=291968 RepID=UPI0003824A33|nr:SDR family oxidoreductase [Acaricomes phytoseiuli]